MRVGAACCSVHDGRLISRSTSAHSRGEIKRFQSGAPAPPGGEENGQEDRQKSIEEIAEDAPPARQAAALAALVRQSREPRHDGALSRALHELRTDAEG